MIRSFIDWQIALSRRFDRHLPSSYRIDGQTEFRNVTVPCHLKREMVVCDVGGGKRPYVSANLKRDLALTNIGIDIDQTELDSAPEGTYSEAICGDITDYCGTGNADLLLCQAVLEHVPDVERALGAIRSILKPGGLALVFVPCRNAIFAKLNLLLPEGLKRRLLFAIYPQFRQVSGFRSFYDRCTPRGISEVARRQHLEVLSVNAYFSSSYFSFFFPIHFAWRFWGILSRMIMGDEAAESFTIILKRPDDAGRPQNHDIPRPVRSSSEKSSLQNVLAGSVSTAGRSRLSA